MSTSLQQPRLTRAAFFAWASPDDRRYAFDGFAPVAMTGAGLATSNDGEGRLVTGTVVVFEVPSRSTGRIGRIDKLRECQAVASIRRSVILESRAVGPWVFHHAEGAHVWTAVSLVAGDVPGMPDIGIEVPAGAFYERATFQADAAGAA